MGLPPAFKHARYCQGSTKLPAHIPRSAFSAPRWASSYLPLEYLGQSSVAVRDKPLPDIGAWRSKRARSYRAAVPVSVNWRTADGALDGPEQSSEGRRRSASTLVEVAVVVSAQLSAFGCVDTPDPDPRAVDLDRIAIDHAGLPDQVVRTDRESGQTGDSQREPENSIYFDSQDDFSALQEQANREFWGKTIPLFYGGYPMLLFSMAIRPSRLKRG